MGMLNYLLYPFGIVLEIVCIVHFIRRRPDMYWIYIILFLGPIGCLVYSFMAALPDMEPAQYLLRRHVAAQAPLRARSVMVEDNPSAGNYEELGGSLHR